MYALLYHGVRCTCNNLGSRVHKVETPAYHFNHEHEAAVYFQHRGVYCLKFKKPFDRHSPRHKFYRRIYSFFFHIVYKRVNILFSFISIDFSDEIPNVTNRHTERFPVGSRAHRDRVVRHNVSKTRVLRRVQHSRGDVLADHRIRRVIHQGNTTGDGQKDCGDAQVPGDRDRVLLALFGGLFQSE